MADGRMFTDYRPRCDANLQFQAPMSGSHDYRQFLIANGQRIIDEDRAAAAATALCTPCVQPYDQGTMAPEVDRFVCDKVSCARVASSAAASYGASWPSVAIGTGRDYGMTAGNQRSALAAGFAGSQS